MHLPDLGGCGFVQLGPNGLVVQAGSGQRQGFSSLGFWYVGVTTRQLINQLPFTGSF